MPALFFSGGIDSTTLAYDVALHPYRYGIGHEEKLILVTTGTKEKRTQLAPVTRDLKKRTALEVEHIVVSDGLIVTEGEPLRRGGMQTLNPLVTRDQRDLAAIPYTAGWMLWMAAFATNLLAAEEEANYSPQQAFIAHQWNGPDWRAIDAGSNKFDCTPAIFEHLNKAIAACSEDVRIRCPFLENRMNRAMVVELAMELKVPLQLTSSCLLGWRRDCEACSACMLRRAAFKTLGLNENGYRR